jgi:hypothetical protein
MTAMKILNQETHEDHEGHGGTKTMDGGRAGTRVAGRSFFVSFVGFVVQGLDCR